MYSKKTSINRFFNPRSLAIIGASNQPGSVGFSLVSNVLNNNFPGKVYFVNPKRKKIHGKPVYSSIADLPLGIDLALVATPAATVPGIISQCVAQKTAGAAIISSGFSEIGPKGKKIALQLKEITKSSPLRILGPNCLGFIRPHLNLNASFSGEEAHPGRITLLSQSGALGAAILNWAKQHRIGFANFVSLGEMLDLSFGELIEFFGNDPQTNSILIYMESITKPALFLQAARTLVRKKPIIVLKGGVSQAGAKAALSHTGNLAGDDLVFDTAFKKAGILRVHDLEDLFNCTSALAKQDLPQGENLAIITNAGGPGVIASDILEKNQGKLAKFSQKTNNQLTRILPPTGSIKNPVDLLGDATPRAYHEAAQVCLQDPEVDGLVVILTPQGVTDATGAAREISNLENPQKKPILAVWMGEADGLQTLHEASIPAYQFPRQGIKTFLYMNQYFQNLKNLSPVSNKPLPNYVPDSQEAIRIIRQAQRAKQTLLSEWESKQILKAYGFPIPLSYLAKSIKESTLAAVKIGFPLVLKLHSTKVSHKIDLEGVKLGLRSVKGVKEAFREIKSSWQKHFSSREFEGVLVEKMFSHRHEFIIGSKKDPIFGPVIVFGRGGTEVELINDLALEMPPLDPYLARNLVIRTKVAPLFSGYRNLPQPSLKKMITLLCKFSRLVTDFPQIKEMDINPLAWGRGDYQALDCKIILDL
ncbi:acetate--CoA ligase family protein [Patescibacteria group bacterium]